MKWVAVPQRGIWRSSCGQFEIIKLAKDWFLWDRLKETATYWPREIDAKRAAFACLPPLEQLARQA